MIRRIFPATLLVAAAVSFAAPASAQPRCELTAGGKMLVSLAANIKSARTADGHGSRAASDASTALLKTDGGGMARPVDQPMKVRAPQDGTAGGASHTEREA